MSIAEVRARTSVIYINHDGVVLLHSHCVGLFQLLIKYFLKNHMNLFLEDEEGFFKNNHRCNKTPPGSSVLDYSQKTKAVLK